MRHLCDVLSNCNGSVAEVDAVLRKYEGNGAVRSSRWALSGKSDAEKLRANLETHTPALSLVLDMMNLSVLSPTHMSEAC